MELTENQALTSNQKCMFLLSILSCSLTVRGKRWVEVITIEQGKCSFSHSFIYFIGLFILHVFIFIHNYADIIDKTY